MKLNRKLLSALLTAVMLLTALMPAASAAQLKATYETPSYYSVATTAYSRMLVFRSGVVAAADKNQKYGLIDAAGTVKVPFQYDKLEYAAGDLFIVTVKAAGGNTYGLINSAGKEVLPATAKGIQVQNNTLLVTDASYKSTYYTADMKSSTQDAFYGANSSGSSGTIPGYDWSYEIGAGYYVGSNDKGSALLDSAKKVAIAAGKYTDYRYVSSKGQSAMFSVSDADGKRGVVDAAGKVVVPFGDYDYVGGFSAQGYLSVVNYDGYGSEKTNLSSTLYDAKGSVVKTWSDREINTENYYRDLVFSLDGAHYGTMDSAGKVFLPDKFTALTQETDAEKMIVGVENTKDPDAWYSLKGIYSLDGKELIAPKYDELKVLGGDRYRLFDGTHYGVMSADTGKVMIPFNYESIQVFSRDFLYLSDGTSYSVVTADNKQVVPASKDGVAVFDDYLPIERTLDNYYYNRMLDNYDAAVLPFVSKTAGGYTTTYADYLTGEVLGSLPYLASNITSDGRFVYRGENGLMGYGQLDGSLKNPAAPASGAGSAGSTTPSGGTAYATTGYKIQVDGKTVDFDLYALKDAKGNDTNYIKLRDVAYQLNGTKAQFNVGWDGSIKLTRGEAYVANGSEMSTPFSGDQRYQDSKSAVLIDGEKVDLSAILLTDSKGSGYTYFKLRDLGAALGFNVSYKDGMIVINTDEAYSAD